MYTKSSKFQYMLLKSRLHVPTIAVSSSATIHFECIKPGVYRYILTPASIRPLEHDDVGENLYVSIISRAKKYVYIFTPYLILGTELSHAMISAARSGVDVRIIMLKW